jgi:hypothetical protein
MLQSVSPCSSDLPLGARSALVISLALKASSGHYALVTHTSDRRSIVFVRIALASAATALVVAGCSGDAHPAATSQTTVHLGSASEVSNVATTGGSLGVQRISLTCSDSVGPGTPADGGDLTVSGLTFSGVPARGPAPLGSISAGPSGNVYSFRKVFLYVSPTAANETLVEVAAPEDGRIYYTDEDHWSSKSIASDVVTQSAKSALIPRCGDTSRGFLGGLMTQNSNCITLTITPDAGEPQTVRMPINSATC